MLRAAWDATVVTATILGVILGACACMGILIVLIAMAMSYEQPQASFAGLGATAFGIWIVCFCTALANSRGLRT